MISSERERGRNRSSHVTGAAVICVVKTVLIAMLFTIPLLAFTAALLVVASKVFDRDRFADILEVLLRAVAARIEGSPRSGDRSTHE